MDEQEKKQGETPAPENKQSNRENPGKNKHNKRNHHKGKGKGENRPPRRSNPVEWYVPNQMLLKDVATLPYNTLTGRVLNIKPYADKFNQETKAKALPGVLAIDCSLSLGYTKSNVDTINVAARSIYTYVRHQNSGHSNYESVDLMLYIQAMQEIYAAYAEARRIYGIAMTYKMTNRYIPKTILEALRVNPEDIANNLAQYRAGLNIIGSKIGSLCVPINFTSVNRQTMLFSNVYLDAETERGQYYVFRRDYGRKFDATGSATGGRLVAYKVSDDRDYTDVLDELNSMIDTILSDEDMNIMSGDILKAYGREKLFMVQGTEDNYTVQPVYDVTVLNQISNAHWIINASDMRLNDESMNITQEEGNLRFKPYVEYVTQQGVPPKYGPVTNSVLKEKYYNLTGYLFNCDVVQPTPEFNIESSRCITILHATNESSANAEILMGSELYSSITLYQIDETGSTLSTPVYQYLTLDTGNGTIVTNFINSLTIECWSYHPPLYILQYDEAVGTAQAWNYFQSVNVVMVLSDDVISNLHQCALLGEFRTDLLK